MSCVEATVNCLEQGYICSQAILVTYGPKLGLDEENALKIASTFGGGMGITGETCGAVTGALMVLGLKHDLDDPQAKEKSLARAREYLDKFKSRKGSVICRDLLGHDISSPEGLAFIKGSQLFSTICPKLVQAAAEILEEML